MNGYMEKYSKSAILERENSAAFTFAFGLFLLYVTFVKHDRYTEIEAGVVYLLLVVLLHICKHVKNARFVSKIIDHRFVPLKQATYPNYNSTCNRELYRSRYMCALCTLLTEELYIVYTKREEKNLKEFVKENVM